MTKDELQQANAQLNQLNKSLEWQDEKLRQEFAKAFSWYQTKVGYSGEKEIADPSWQEIFIQVGKLLERQQKLNYVDDVEAMQIVLNQLRPDVEQLKENCSDFVPQINL